MVPKLHRILIVDDDRDILSNLSDILTDEGYETEIAVDGSSALEKILKHGPDHGCRFDLCLLDFNMPGMNGVDLYQEIRSQTPNLRAIMMTAFCGVEESSRAHTEGTMKVLHKPIDIPLLLKLIHEALTKKGI